MDNLPDWWKSENPWIISDCKPGMKQMPNNSVDSIVTDPPYELGFMGKKWDNTGIAYDIEMWKECLRVLKPGGYLMAFGGTRTYHRMACAIEDAGFEIRDMIEWVYGSGFPKSHNIGKAVDKLRGNERERIEPTGRYKYSFADNTGKFVNCRDSDKAERKSVGLTKGTSEWEGWGTALKPAHEPICMARKPLSEKTVAKNVLKHRTGGINIDQSRVGFISKEDKEESTGKNKHAEYKNSVVRNSAKNGIYHADNRPPENYEPTGRFPANLIHDNSEEVRECFPDTKTGSIKPHKDNSDAQFKQLHTEYITSNYTGDKGNASRFFKSIIYMPKASKAERNRGCEGLEPKQTKGGGGMNNTEDDVCGKYGSIKSEGHNNHPTVKPVKLIEYLITMVTPEGGIVLDPFLGSGTLLVVANNLNVTGLGFEMNEEYGAIIEKRSMQKISKLTDFGDD